ncbi:His-Xaa-Ser system radical SAM maturase HxsC [Hoeflea sp. WL0058]|uniref:His-Xaa-Ser system radical SAM maturase HxsC n=1 Tax=Flavimaribacter sediminis TaxID=2865987 RepID=A0AAE3D3N3_9HYPH|nr:His-Xaa-Ser system radical SAM maturase HxsC [Flavimaribacter sediminis]MBW8639996.1 His-Xaa-Ser system radical SAM maturase HxsC [Flavimaribacter sediminis]
MMNLRVPIADFRTDRPLVTRLRSCKETDDKSSLRMDSILVRNEGEWSTYYFHDQRFRIKAPEQDVDGDVLLIFPGQSAAHRIIRSRSLHNTFLVTEQCDQLCVMCSQPPKKQHTDLFNLFLDAALLAPNNSVLGVSGGEPLLHKEKLFVFLENILSYRKDLSFHVLSNGQNFSAEDCTFLNSPAAERILWGIPIYAPEAETHDRIVGKEGAFNQLIESFTILSHTLARIELRTVLLQSNYSTLHYLADFITDYLPYSEYWAIMQLENIGYGKLNWSSEFFDSSIEFQNIARALNIASGRGLSVSLFNFPLCTIPEAYRRYSVNSISDWKQKYFSECNNCSERLHCGGFFRWYDLANGYKRVSGI